MEILDIVSLEELQEMQDTFALATGMAAITVDMKGAFITRPSNFSDFCMKYTRKSELGAKRCERCDAEGKGSYFCHAGLMDFAEPIIINGVQYGNVLGGQVLPEEPDEEKFREIARELGIPEEDYIQALRKVSVRSEETIRAASKLLKELVNIFVNFKYVMKKNETKLIVLDEELENMIARTKDIATRAKSLGRISKEQTILSLNASIEAGRAGDAGKGFSIVANQMGELAESSATIYQAIIEDASKIHTAVEHLEETLK